MLTLLSVLLGRGAESLETGFSYTGVEARVADNTL